jgi:alanine racemase
MITPNTWVEIDRAALLANVHSCRQVIGPRCQLLAMVKGNAYGHGLREIARVLLGAGVDMLGVEAIGEAVALRTVGITSPILLVGPFPPANVPLLLAHRLMPLLASPEQVQVVGEHTRQTTGGLDVHLKFDTGMHRQGIMRHEVPELLDLLAKYPALRVSGVATHLARADEAEQPEWTRRQLDQFHDILAMLAAAGIRAPIRHAANSAAALLWPETHLDMVRFGIALYGFWPGPAVQRVSAEKLMLRPVMAWKTRVAAVKEVGCGCHVGYSGSYVTTRDSRIAVLPLGYYDGYGRNLSNRGQVLVHGQRAPVCGRVSMNLMSVDVTDVPAVEPGDEVVLIGPQGTSAIAAEEMAAWLGTIHYEVTARINPLIPRIVVDSPTNLSGGSR